MASVSYLTHSWLHYSPSISSPEALRVATLHQNMALTGSKGKSNIKGRGSSKSSSKVATKSRPAGGISPIEEKGQSQSQRQSQSQSQRGAVSGAGAGRGGDTSFTSLKSSMQDYFQSIRDVTNSFMHPREQPTPAPAPVSTTATASSTATASARSVSSSTSLFDFKDAIEEYELALQTEEGSQLEANLRRRGGDVSVSREEDRQEAATQRATGGGAAKECGEKEQEGEAPDSGAGAGSSVGAAGASAAVSRRRGQRSTPSGTNQKQQEQPEVDLELELSPASRHLSAFLHTHRAAVVYRLMSVVTLRSVNHENICCINSTLLVLVFAQRM
jgi:hypothetical protein